MAHPNAWVVHRPHAPSSGYNHTFTGEAYTLKHKPTDHLWKMERIAKVGCLAMPSLSKCGRSTLMICSRQCAHPYMQPLCIHSMLAVLGHDGIGQGYISVLPFADQCMLERALKTAQEECSPSVCEAPLQSSVLAMHQCFQLCYLYAVRRT